MKNIELLAPCGDFECLKAAVQNGADSVYLGASNFSARASATNFNLDELKEAVCYAKLRNVDIHLTLNTLIENNEFESALELAKNAYNLGIDAIIVQDLGLANCLINNLPDLPIHASTQMTVHNLEGVKVLEKLGFKRVVLSRELSIDEIKYICENTDAEIEVFTHGALCISYSGRCYISSMIGGRSGNRGKCAQACRLPYTLCEDNNVLDKGFLLSPRDLCSLEYLPQLVKSGVSCLKIEGRMKTPEYVATVTRIYRKYLDKALKGEKYTVSENDKRDLMQVFNRGGFSSGHLETEANKKLIYPIKPNNIGLYLGQVQKFQANKGYITLKPEEEISIGDTISLDKEDGKYTISELMQNGKNIKSAKNNLVEIGRMKGNIHIGDKIYKMSSKELSRLAKESYEKENRKIHLDCIINVNQNEKISLIINPTVKSGIYSDLAVNIISDIVPELATNSPISSQRIEDSIRKTGNTQFEFDNVWVNLDDGLYIPSISRLNELRRNALEKLEQLAVRKFTHNKLSIDEPKVDLALSDSNKKISLLLNTLNMDYDYSKLNTVDNIYIPFKYFLDTNFTSIINEFQNIYIYMPCIIRKNKIESVKNSLENIVKNFNIKGLVLSNLGDLKLIPINSNLEIVANYTLNVFNKQTINSLLNIGFNRVTSSFELPEAQVKELNSLPLEAIVYGNMPVMTLNYCLLGKANHCYKDCKQMCKQGRYFIKDRVNLEFPILPDSSCTVTTIYNSKTTSIVPSLIPASSYRIDILYEDIDEINTIIEAVRKNERLEGKQYTNNNMNREI